MGRADWELRFTEYFTARVQPLRRLAYGLCGDWHTAEDIVQLTFVRLYSAWPRVRADSVDQYTRRVPVNVFLSHRRTRRWEALTASPPERPAPDGPAVADRLALHAAPNSPLGPELSCSPDSSYARRLPAGPRHPEDRLSIDSGSRLSGRLGSWWT